MKQWRTNMPKQPKVLIVQGKDINLFRDNMGNLVQLIAMAANQMNQESETLLKQELQNAIQFIDDMRMFFLKIGSADALKIDK